MLILKKEKGFTRTLSSKVSGFTLIELLVVVDIIGILATITVAVLTSAKKKGEDSGIKEQMTALRTQAELYASENSDSFDGMFTNNNTWASGDATIQAILDYIGGQTLVHAAGSSSNAWAVQAQLKEDTTQYACIDTSAVLSVSANAMADGGTVCP